MNLIDRFLNKITMYRLVLYYLIFLLVVAATFGAMGILPYSPLAVASSTAVLLAVAWITNTVFAKTFKAHPNVESVYITALILALIITPPTALFDTHYLPLAFWASAIAIASWRCSPNSSPTSFSTRPR